MGRTQRGFPACELDLEISQEGETLATLHARRYYLQWAGVPAGALSAMKAILSAPPETHREVDLGTAFGGAQVILLAFEQVIHLKVLGIDSAPHPSLFEVTLSELEVQALLEAIENADKDLG